MTTLERASRLTGAPVAWLVNEGARVAADSIATDGAVEADWARTWRRQSVPLPQLPQELMRRMARLAKVQGVALDEVVARALRSARGKGFTR